jgi:hypothetical protein
MLCGVKVFLFHFAKVGYHYAHPGVIHVCVYKLIVAGAKSYGYWVWVNMYMFWSLAEE